MVAKKNKKEMQEKRVTISVRDVVVLLLGVLCGVGAGLLAFAAGQVLAAAVLAGVGAAGAAVYFFDRIIQ